MKQNICAACGREIPVGYATYCDRCRKMRQIVTNKRAARTRSRMAHERAHALLCKEAKDAEKETKI